MYLRRLFPTYLKAPKIKKSIFMNSKAFAVTYHSSDGTKDGDFGMMDEKFEKLARSDMILPRSPRILIIDGYTKKGRDQLVENGASTAGDLYVRMLKKCSPIGVECSVVYPCDSPAGAYIQNFPQIMKYDGVAWTGSSLTAYSGEDEVLKMIALVRHFFDVGIPQFGSCFALQLAAYVAGGSVQKSPRGREMGIGRKILLNNVGRSHPLYFGKPTVFDVFESHEDEVTHLPPTGLSLSGNSHSSIQAGVVTYNHGEFWAVQYHPEYDLKELANLTKARTQKLISMGFFRNEADVNQYVADLLEIHQNPYETKSLQWKYGISDDILSEDIKLIEPKNWIKHQVLPYQQARLTKEAIKRRSER